MRRHTFPVARILILFVFLLSACGQVETSPTPTLTPAPPTETATPTNIPTATPTITSTPDPDLPCGGVMAERVTLFLDCNDIRRIRAAYETTGLEFHQDWSILKTTVDNYRANFPTAYDPDASWDVLWWGSGNFVARDMALLYLVTGEEAYARDILRLLELVRTNTPQHASLTNFDTPDGRGEEYAGGILSHPAFGGVVIQSTLFAYLAIRETALLDDAQRAEYDGFFQHQAELLEQAAILRGNDTPLDAARNRNVPFAANVAALTIARAFPDDPGMQALDARLWPTLEWQIGNWWEADGGWGENTQNYGFSMLEGLVLLAETSVRNGGPDLYAQSFEGRSINLLCRFYLETVTPEGSVPALNDTGFYPVDPGLFRLCGFRSGDPQLYFAEELYNAGRHRSYGVDATAFTTPFHLLAWSGLDDRTAETPDHTSVLLADTGAAILRDGWERDGQYALLQFTASRSHEEYSYGTLYLYDHGPWLVGNGYHIPAGRPTDQHSTLSMDNANQTYTGGEVVAFADLGAAGIAGITSRSYPSLQHTRLVLWNKGWSQWIVIDDAVSDSYQHTLQQRWYVWGDAILTNENVWYFDHESNNYILAIQMLPGQPATYADISRRYDWEQWVSNAAGVRMDVSYPGRPVRLVTSLSVFLRGNTAEAITRTDEAGGTRIDSQSRETTWTWLLPPLGETGGTIGAYALTGTAGCIVHQEEALASYCLMNGTSLANQDRVLVTASGNVSLEASFAAGKVHVDTAGSTRLTFYWPEPMTTLTEAGTQLEFTTENGLITVQVSAGRHVLEIR